jgi:hypothetical protein
MAIDVTVDATPKQRLPYDPNDIPEAVRERAARVDALYSNGPPAESPPGEPGPVQLPLPGLEPPQAPPGNNSPPAVAAERAADPDEQSWHHRFLAMQGRYNASQRTLGEMQEQMVQLGNELVHAQQQPAARQEQPQQRSVEAPRYLTEKDVQDYGSDLVNFTQRAAAEAMAPQILAIEQQNRELQARLAQEARARLDMRVEAAIPQFRDIDRDPRWHRWLLGIDMLSGRVRQTLLDEAISAADAPRAISFFRGFLNEEFATGHIEPAFNSQQPAAPREAAVPLASLAAPGRARPTTGGDFGGLPESRLYTRAQIAQLYTAHRKGAYVGREAEWNRQEADIIAAGREGRVS